MADQRDPFDGGDGHADGSGIQRVERSSGLAWGVILSFALIALLVIFAVQNTEAVHVEFLWLEGQFPLAIVILATAAAAVLIAELGGVVYRNRRRKRRAEKEELRRLRESQTDD